MSRIKKANRIWIALTATLLALAAAWAGGLWLRAPRTDVSPAEPIDGVRRQETRSTTLVDSQPSSSAVQLASYPFAQYGQLPEGYIGTAACASCHANRHESYLQTHHSRSLREVDLATEQVGVTLDHPLSQRSYDIVAKEGQLWHREWMQLGDAKDDRFQVNELPVCYVMGSGAFAKGYLLGDGEYLLQSPVTWYVGGRKFGMAPGYDVKHQRGFNRMINDECLFCHAGLVTQRNDNVHQPAIHELAIGCERCHGPGRAHSELYHKIESGELKVSPGLDPKIVDPAKLDRDALESICSQCHLHGDVVIHAAGAQAWDFTAGEELAQTRIHYKAGNPGETEKVFTGHFDQMYQSPCYQGSETLTCVTCHDPHRSEPITDRAALHREQCNACHGEQGCGVALDDRIARAENNCVHCHMPSIDSEIPHTSTTNHWIAVYESGKPRGMESSIAESSSETVLRRVQPSPNLSEQELARRDLLGQAFWAMDQAQLGNVKQLSLFPAAEKLTALLRGDRTDSQIYSLLARKARFIADAAPESGENQSLIEQQWQLAATNATKSLQLETRPDKAREAALEVLGNQLMQADDYANAVDCFRELTLIRRAAVDWYNLGLCLARVGRLGDAEQSLRESIRIDAAYAAPYRSLAILYRAISPDASRQLSERAARLAD